MGVVLSLSIQAEDPEFPDWLRGKPDVVMKSDRCGVYEWIINEADKQTEGKASKDDLALQRVINIANKLVDYHRTEPLEDYSARIKYLIFGETGAFHFAFRISDEEIERSLNRDCGE